MSWDLVKVLCWAVAAVLFVVGAYSDDHFQELVGWGLAWTTAGLLAGVLPGLSGRASGG